jgi:hypothetical protein
MWRIEQPLFPLATRAKASNFVRLANVTEWSDRFPSTKGFSRVVFRPFFLGQTVATLDGVREVPQTQPIPARGLRPILLLSIVLEAPTLALPTDVGIPPGRPI